MTALFFFSGIITNTRAIPQTSATNLNRNDVCWTAGGWQSVVNDTTNMVFIPWSGNPSFGATYIYESLFGWNSLTGEYIPCLGENIDWSGNVVTIKLWDEAIWTGPGTEAAVVNRLIIPGVNDNITAADIIYSFELLNHTRWGDFRMNIDNISQGTSEKHVVFTLKPGMNYNADFKDWITTNIPIVNKDVWEDINSYYGYDPTDHIDTNVFRNRWDDLVECPEKWHILSGPYMQTGDPDDFNNDYELYVKNPDWWGNGILYRDIMGPGAEKDISSSNKAENVHPQYIGTRFYSTDPLNQVIAMDAGELDLTSTGYPYFKDNMTNGNLHLWYADNDVRSYASLGSYIELAFNTLKFPLCEPWFRRAIAHAIYYKPISTEAAANNWLRASPTLLNPLNPEHEVLFNSPIHDNYKFDTDIDLAIQLLEQNGCYRKLIGDKYVWFCEVPYYLPELVEIYPSDDDPDKAGMQVQLGPYQIIVPEGWTDVVIATDFYAQSLSDYIGIEASVTEVGSQNWQDQINDNTFNLALWCVGPQTVGNPNQMFHSIAQNHHAWGNASSWRGPNAVNFVSALGGYVNTEDLAMQQIYANTMQEAFAQDLPSIPTHINCIYYQYSNLYWKGYNNEGWQYNQISHIADTSNIVIKQRLILSLAPSSSAWNPPANFNIQYNWPPGEEYWNGDKPNWIPPEDWYPPDYTEEPNTFPPGDTGDGNPFDIPWNGLTTSMIIGLLGCIFLVQKRRK